MFGLHVSAAALTVIIDVMMFGGELVSAGFFFPLEIMAAVVLSFIVYRIQKHWYGDPHDSALTKALIVGLVTAIPVPLTPLIVIPGGLVGLVHTVSRRLKR